ncbi:MAG: LPS export ABC transporter periplasmic protein LptC [Thermodesulfobacteriota bacterium]|nr:LPS export ABC transporter periplasmic protein LptC [Thermodesulfobacteriota bacterium]
MKKIRLLLFLSIACLSVVIFVILFYGGKNEEFGQKILLHGKAHATIEKLHYIDTQGDIKKWELIADSCEYFDNRSLATFMSPVVNFFQKNGETITVIGDKGIFYIDEKRVDLRDNVVVTSSEGYRLVTNALLYDAEEKKIQNNGPFTLSTYRGGRITGKGILIEMDDHRFHVLQAVKASFRM